MSTSDLSPPLVPDLDRAVFMVLDDFGPLSRAGARWMRMTPISKARSPTSSPGSIVIRLGDRVQRRRGLVERRIGKHRADEPASVRASRRGGAGFPPGF